MTDYPTEQEFLDFLNTGNNKAMLEQARMVAGYFLSHTVKDCSINELVGAYVVAGVTAYGAAILKEINGSIERVADALEKMTGEYGCLEISIEQIGDAIDELKNAIRGVSNSIHQCS